MATLQYRCRRCNEVFDLGDIDTEEEIQQALIRKLQEAAGHGDFLSLMMKEWHLHNCDDDGKGVIDVAGYKP